MLNTMEPISFDPDRLTTTHDFGGEGCIYPRWATFRVKKLLSVFGKDWFAGKTVLELACGIGFVGRELQKYGANVTFTEGRSEYLNEIISKGNGSQVYQIDQEEPWDFGRKFDLVLHWGILYHLKEWKRDLKTALKHGTYLSLDTEVMDSKYATEEIPIEERGYNQAIHGIGVRPAWGAIEVFLKEHAESFKRYDDSDLNVVDHHESITYDWKPGFIVGKNDPTNTNIMSHWMPGYRRFWVVKCK